MNVVYHLTSPVPDMAETDAVVQEVRLLQHRLGGQTLNLFPLRRPSRFYPRALYGLHCRRALRALDASAALHHVFFPLLYPFPVLAELRRPVVYSVIGGLGGQRRPRPGRALKAIRWIVVSNGRDLEALHGWGLRDCSEIRPGIDVTRFRPAPPPGGPGFSLLVGSAPWTVEQFRLKGIDALLAAAHRIPDLRLVFLWRGMHFETLKRRVAERRVTRQVDILNEWVDVNAVLAHMHAAVVLAQHARVVKAYPHSLMESLAAGKPVLVSRAIPMSDYVQANGCGDVVDRVDADDVVRAIGALRADYERRRAQAVARGPSDFSQERVVAACAEIYARVLR